MPVARPATDVVAAPKMRRQRILDAASAVFDAVGYESATVRQIAAACGLTDAALYYYFHSKREILEALIDEYRRAPLPIAGGEAQPLTRGQLEAAVDAFLDAAAVNLDAMMITARQALLTAQFRDVRGARREAWRQSFRAHFATLLQHEEAELMADSVLTFLTGVIFTLRTELGRELPARLCEPEFREWVHDLLTVAAPFERFLPGAAAR